MPCLNGGIALFILIHYTFNRKCPFVWICLNKFNMPHCHQLNVILFKLLWCCRLFLVVPHHPCHLFLIIFEITVSINSIPSISRFVIHAWHCRQCAQGILNRSGQAIVDDKFMFVNDGRYDCGNTGSVAPTCQIIWSSQKENVYKLVWNIFVISIHGLVYFQQNIKQFFVGFPVTKDAITLKLHQQFFLECIVLIIIDDPPFNYKPTNVSIKCIVFIQ